MPDLTAESQKRHERFVRGVVASGEVWTLKGAEGFCVSASNGEADDDDDDVEHEVMPFWSDRADAQRCATGEWSAYKPEAISLDDFMNCWLPGMHDDDVLAGTNWNADLVGREVDPLELKEELEAAAPSRSQE